MSIGTPWIGTAVSGSAGGTTITLDATGATVGEWVFVAILIADSQASAPTAPSGWTITGQGREGTTGSASSCLTVYQHLKQTGDTTQAFTWPTTRKFEACIWSWPGLDQTTPVEGVTYLAHSTSSFSYPTGTVTPTNTDRWIAMIAGARGVLANQSWTADGAMTERIDVNHGGTTPFTSIGVADTAGAVSQTGHSYTATDNMLDYNGGTLALALIPANAVVQQQVRRTRVALPLRPRRAGRTSGGIGAPALPTHQPIRRTRIALSRLRARASTPVPAQVVTQPPINPLQAMRRVRQALAGIRRRSATPVPAQSPAVAPAYVPQGTRRLRQILGRARTRAAATIQITTTPVMITAPGNLLPSTLAGQATSTTSSATAITSTTAGGGTTSTLGGAG